MATNIGTAYQNTKLEAADLLKKAYALRVNNLEGSILLADRASQMAKQLNDEELLAESWNQLALFNMILGKFEESKAFSIKALTFYEKTNNLKGIADAKYSLAGVHYKTDHYHLGLEVLLDCLYIYRTLQDHFNEARVLKSIGTIYEFFGDEENAINAYLSAVEAGRLAGDPNLESNAYNPLSGIYLKRGLTDLALSTIEKSISIKQETKDIRGLAFALYGRGKIFLKLGKIPEGKRDLMHCLEIQHQQGDKLGIAMAYNKIGMMFLHLGQLDQAKENLINARKLAEEYNIQVIRYKTLYNLHLVARAENNLVEALYYFNKYITLK